MLSKKAFRAKFKAIQKKAKCDLLESGHWKEKEVYLAQVIEQPIFQIPNILFVYFFIDLFVKHIFFEANESALSFFDFRLFHLQKQVLTQIVMFQSMIKKPKKVNDFFFLAFFPWFHPVFGHEIAGNQRN